MKEKKIKENENDFVIENQGVGGIKVSFKGEDVDMEKCIEDEVEDEIVDNIFGLKAEAITAEETPKEKAKKNSSSIKKYYKCRFNPAWLEDPGLREWLLPIEDDITRCECLYCGRVMRSHRTDINTHAKRYKHKKNRDKYILQNGVAEVSLRYIRDENYPTPKKRRKSVRKNSETGINIEKGFEDFYDNDLVIQFDDLQADKREDISKYQKDRQMSVLANRVIMSLLDDTESFLKSKTNVIYNSLVDNETILDQRMFKRVRGMCIGHLANKYISEAALEISIADVTHAKERELNGSSTITDKLNTLEKQLQDTDYTYRRQPQIYRTLRTFWWKAEVSALVPEIRKYVTEMNSFKQHSFTKDLPDAE